MATISANDAATGEKGADKGDSARRRRASLAVTSARAALAKADDAEQMLAIFFECAREHFDYTALFMVHGDVAAGRFASGRGASNERVLEIGIPLDIASLFASARDAGAPYCARPSTESFDAVLLRDFERSTKAPVMVVPVLIGPRVVALLYCDDGENGVDPARDTGVLMIADEVGRALEALLAANKKSQRRQTFDESARYSTSPSLGSSSRLFAADAAAVSVSPRRPPSPQSPRSSSQLPSVIVEDEGFTALVQRLISKGGDDDAEAELVRHGHHAMPALMAQFPGPVVAAEQRLRSAMRPSEMGAVLRVIARQRKAALPFVLSCLDDSDANRRYWATFLLVELAYDEAATPLIARLFDAEASIQEVARRALGAVAHMSPAAVAAALVIAVKSPQFTEEQRVFMLDAVAELRHGRAAGVLVQLLSESNEQVVRGVRRALVSTTCHDFGVDFARWQRWWLDNRQRHRVQWLIDAIANPDARLRSDALRELALVTRSRFTLWGAMSAGEVATLQQRYREWWSQEGERRFVP